MFDDIDEEPTLFIRIDDKFVCIDCLYDEGLKIFVFAYRPPSGKICSYCEGNAKSIPVSDLQGHILDFFPYVPVESVSPRNDGEWLIPGKSSEEWIENLIEGKVCGELYEDLVENAVDQNYDEEDWSSLGLSAQWKGQWKEFCEVVNIDNGSFGLEVSASKAERDRDKPHPAFFCNAIATALLRADAVSTLSPGSKIIRARWGHVSRTFEALTCPPSHIAGANRFSPKGISMFYGANDCETACLEIKAVPGDNITLGVFETKRELALIDFTTTKFPRGDFDPSWIGNYYISDFLKGFLADIREDVKGEGNRSEYLPTQALCDFFKKEGAAELLSVSSHDPEPSAVLKLIAKNRRLDGIRFHSSKVIGERSDCFVLFCDHEQSSTLLELVAHDHLIFEESQAGRSNLTP